MPDITVELALDAEDVDAARGLCREWLDWHWRNFPPDWSRLDNPMEPEGFARIVAALPELHARPRGGILLARLDGVPAGCVMYAEAAPDTAEFNRFFVNEAGRGHGIGQRLLNAMFAQMAADGYARVMFSSAVFLTHARALYERVGFRDMPHPEGFPEALRDYVYFMHRPLGATA